MKYLYMLKSAMLALGIASSFGSHAMFISDSDTNPLELTEINQKLTLDKFDSDLGTLTAATLKLSAEAVSQIFLENHSPNPVDIDYSSGIGLLFSSTLGLGIVGDAYHPTMKTDLWRVAGGRIGGHGEGEHGEGEHELDNNRNDERSMSAAMTIEIDLDQYAQDLTLAGGGTFNIECTSTVSTAVVGGGGNVEVDQTTHAACSAWIGYEFQAAVIDPPLSVPEPSTLGLIALSLLGVRRVRMRVS